MAANVARQIDENLKDYYNDKIEKGKHYSSAVNATAAKLLAIMYWVIKNILDISFNLTLYPITIFNSIYFISAFYFKPKFHLCILQSHLSFR